MEARSSVQRERQRQEQERLDKIINEKIAKVKSEIQGSVQIYIDSVLFFFFSINYS